MNLIDLKRQLPKPKCVVCGAPTSGQFKPNEFPVILPVCHYCIDGAEHGPSALTHWLLKRMPEAFENFKPVFN